jgi:hypothetical protein
VDHALAVVGVLQLHPDLLLARAIFDDVVIVDEAFVLQHLRNTDTDLAVPHQHEAPANAVGVADSCQHVRDGILIVHRCSRPLDQSRLPTWPLRARELPATSSPS